ncbi:hypothetical protein SAMN05216276_106710 [Streptosporangium subroseum]|uniref:Uncharacterized protein n=1 Tax=Streptosporangium subroseum TaxID=106412 RepID=A0A239NRN2_9ACTN|nr:hypothetical protein [Streptosporangium subroseum]SNT57547.1 hypothetical protein SAMN05216276_106710 [Streptosporangium subroseum]
MFGRRLARVLHVRDGRLELLSRRGKDPVESIDLGPIPADALATALARVPDLLTFPTEAAVEIDCRVEEVEEVEGKDRVADLVQLTGDDLYPVKGKELYDYDDDWDNEEWDEEDWDEEDWDDYNAGRKHAWSRYGGACTRYDGLTAVRIHINGVLHLVAEVDGRWTLIPMDIYPGDGPPIPRVCEYFDHDSCGCDNGFWPSNSHWWTGSGNVRGDLHIAWATGVEDGDVLVARCSVEEFERRVAAWDYLGCPGECVIEIEE